MGYAPDSWDALREHLKGRGFSEGELLEGGPPRRRRDSGLYDRFRHRAVDPHSRRARARRRLRLAHAAGGGRRRADGDSESPKYLNTPQTPIFDKGAILFGLDRAAEQHPPRRRGGHRGRLYGRHCRPSARQRQRRRQHGHGAHGATARPAAPAHGEHRPRLRPRHAPDRRRASAATWSPSGLGVQMRVMKLPKGRDPDEIIRADPEGWRRLVIEAEAPKAFSAAAHPVDADGARPADVQARRSAGAGDEERVDLVEGRGDVPGAAHPLPASARAGAGAGRGAVRRTENRQVFEAWRAAAPERRLWRRRCRRSCARIWSTCIGRDLPPYDPAQAEKALQTVRSA